jgi:hypothetical protein
MNCLDIPLDEPYQICCDNVNLSQIDGMDICLNCYSQHENPQFEDTRVDRIVAPSSSRYKKFQQLLIKNKIPWHVTDTLCDRFNSIERHHESTNKTNFVNMNQLVICLLKRMGYPEQCDGFKQLKTEFRRNIVDEFVDKALGPSSDLPTGNLLKDLEFTLIGEQSGFCNHAKVVPSAVYADKY